MAIAQPQVYSNRKSYTSVLPCRVQSTSDKPILFGAKFTMQADFYGSILSTKYGISVVTPEKADQDYIHREFFRRIPRSHPDRRRLESELFELCSRYGKRPNKAFRINIPREYF